jgi:hypothetical protein
MYVRKIRPEEFGMIVPGDPGTRLAIYDAIANRLHYNLINHIASMLKPFNRLANNLECVADVDGIIITMPEYGKFLDKGTKGRVMYKHIGKTVPVGNGEVRKVTPEAIAKGKWYNPGIRPMNFVDNAVMSTIREIRIV